MAARAAHARSMQAAKHALQTAAETGMQALAAAAAHAPGMERFLQLLQDPATLELLSVRAQALELEPAPDLAADEEDSDSDVNLVHHCELCTPVTMIACCKLKA